MQVDDIPNICTVDNDDEQSSTMKIPITGKVQTQKRRKRRTKTDTPENAD